MSVLKYARLSTRFIIKQPCRFYHNKKNFIIKYDYPSIGTPSLFEKQDINLNVVEKYGKYFGFSVWEEVFDYMHSFRMLDQKFLDPFVERMYKYPECSWYILFKYVYPRNDIIERYRHTFDTITWMNIYEIRHPDDDFVDKYKRLLDWTIIVKKEDITLDFIGKYHDMFCYDCWKYILKYYQDKGCMGAKFINIVTLQDNKYVLNDLYEKYGDKIMFPQIHFWNQKIKKLELVNCVPNHENISKLGWNKTMASENLDKLLYDDDWKLASNHNKNAYIYIDDINIMNDQYKQ